MEVVQFTPQEARLEHCRKPRPKASTPKDVVIKIFFSGICGRDLHVLDGTLPCSHDPIILGHEFCGIVSEIGSEVTAVKKGDKVAVDPNSGCGLCDFCHKGQTHFCKVGGTNNTIGFFKNGGWAQYALIPEKQVYKIPEDATLERAVLAQPMACIAHGFDLLSPIQLGQKILIVGIGLFGYLWSALLHFQGHRKVTVSESNLARVEYIQKLEMGFDCITPVILTERHEEDPQYVFDVIIDCSSDAETIEQQFELLNSGGKLCIFGEKPRDFKISISPFDIFKKEIVIIGVNASTFNFPKALILIESLGEKYLDLEGIGIKSYALRDYRDALKHFREGSIVRPMFSNAIQCSCSNKRRSSSIK